MSRVMHALQSIARHELEKRPFCELAVVTSVFDSGDDAQSVTLELKDSGLVVPRVPVATMLTGAAALPRVGDVVVVLFPRGDLNAAIVIGQVYSDQRRPPESTRDSAVLVWPGDADEDESKCVRIELFADGSERRVRITLGGDRDAELLCRDGGIELSAGGVKLALDHSSDSDGTVAITAGGTKIELAQDADLSIEAQGTLTLKAAKVAIEGDVSVKVKGQTVELN